ncbi:ABC transporter permease [Arthrobacter sp. EH-1B-1]|uniref:ABC transporter permease n=1 Tax=Arthrobacter vasquezii TaxID=2977629 RepID=A0ABT6CU66_9MICC|nr:ABC transporter permease [Arthrobacter vasquezii]MDF9277430.1 ABC transporter permease [Arthrobacter vasquezii]
MATPATRRRRTLPLLQGQEIVLIAVLVLLWAALSVSTDTFLTPNNIGAILYQVAPIAIIGVGMTAVMVTAGIDVSVGSQIAVVMVVVAKMLRDFEVALPVAVIVAVLVGSILGAVNALLITVAKIHPIIVTFGTLNIFRWVALQIFGDQQVDGVPGTLTVFGGSNQAMTLGIPNAFLITVLLIATGWVYMRSYAGGRHLYAIGGDAQAARLAGVKVSRATAGVYVLTGACVGLAGVIMIGSGGLVQQNIGSGLELQVIAAAVIGGTSVLGGRGTVLGTLLGALLVGSVGSAVTHLGWPSEVTNLFVGACIVIAVGVDLARQKRRARS